MRGQGGRPRRRPAQRLHGRNNGGYHSAKCEGAVPGARGVWGCGRVMQGGGR